MFTLNPTIDIFYKDQLKENAKVVNSIKLPEIGKHAESSKVYFTYHDVEFEILCQSFDQFIISSLSKVNIGQRSDKFSTRIGNNGLTFHGHGKGFTKRQENELTKGILTIKV